MSPLQRSKVAPFSSVAVISKEPLLIVTSAGLSSCSIPSPMAKGDEASNVTETGRNQKKSYDKVNNESKHTVLHCSLLEHLSGFAMDDGDLDDFFPCPIFGGTVAN